MGQYPREHFHSAFALERQMETGISVTNSKAAKHSSPRAQDDSPNSAQDLQ
jgi:hypothetical protein